MVFWQKFDAWIELFPTTGKVLALTSVLLLSLGAPAAQAADSKGPFYMEMDPVTVQFEHATCKRTIMALNLLIEYTKADKQAQIYALKPKLKSLLFAAFDDHLAEAKVAKRSRVQKIAKRVIQKALGKKLVSDVLISQMMLQK